MSLLLCEGSKRGGGANPAPARCGSLTECEMINRSLPPPHLIGNVMDGDGLSLFNSKFENSI